MVYFNPPVRASSGMASRQTTCHGNVPVDRFIPFSNNCTWRSKESRCRVSYLVALCSSGHHISRISDSCQGLEWKPPKGLSLQRTLTQIAKPPLSRAQSMARRPRMVHHIAVELEHVNLCVNMLNTPSTEFGTVLLFDDLGGWELSN